MTEEPIYVEVSRTWPMARKVCELTPEETAYMAGLLEGEGGFTIVRRLPTPKTGGVMPTFRPVISLAMTDREPVEFCALAFGSRVNARRSQSGRTVYETACRMSHIRGILGAIRPYLRSIRKVREVELLLEFLNPRESMGRRKNRAGQFQSLPIVEMKLRNWLWEEMQRNRDSHPITEASR